MGATMVDTGVPEAALPVAAVAQVTVIKVVLFKRLCREA